MNAEQVLQNSTVQGMVVRLPEGQLDRKIYTEVAKKLELIGGKWKGGKIAGFVFNEDPTELLEQIANGEKRNLKKEFQFFATPEIIADYLVELAELRENDRVLEPSAGQGAIVKAILKKFPEMYIEVCELMPLNRTFLEKIEEAIMLDFDFLNVDIGLYYNQFDKIIANPPFAKNQDIDHINQMYKCLKTGGKLVSIASKHWELSNNKKEKNFREWLSDVGAEIINLEKGDFKESGTMIRGCIISIVK